MKLGTVTLDGRFVRLEPLTDHNRDEVRSALDCDPDAWSIMVNVGCGEHFERWWAQATDGRGLPFAVRRRTDGRVVGTTGYYEIAPAHRRVEIGGTFYAPAERGGPLNPEAKRLLIGHAFDQGAARVEFVTDAINGRSRAALTKLGAVEEGVLRRHKTTWTGRVRDTVMFSITAEEWPAIRDRLDARVAAFG